MSGPTILVVEDEQLVALDIETRLVPLGYHVITAASGEEALACVQRSRPDAILMDIKLDGGIDGIEAAKRIRASMDVPIIYLTAYADNATVDRARASEPYGYILKPFDERELKATIDLALQRHWTDAYRHEQEELHRFLADASARLSESLDDATVIGSAADLLVPRYADSCAIRIEDDGRGPSVMWIRASEGSARHTPGLHGQLVESVLATGQPRLELAAVEPTSLDEILGPDHAAAVRSLPSSPRSFLAVPIPVRGKTLGTIVLVSTRRERIYGGLELAIGEDFGRRVGMAIDNAVLYRDAQRALRAREELLAIVSHDLRSPLGTILMRAQLLARQAASAEPAQAIIRAVQRMNRIIGDLLDAAAIDTGHLSVTKTLHSPAELASESVAALEPVARAKSVRLTCEKANGLVPVPCDADRIVQVLSNLIDNAIKFTPAGGTVLVRVDSSGDGVRFSVSDTGPGIDEEQLPHVFERFWRAQASGRGAGLGLFIVQGIVNAHGGAVSVETRVGHGSTFAFMLPAAEGPPAAPARRAG